MYDALPQLSLPPPNNARPALQAQISALPETAPASRERNQAIDQCLEGIDRLSHEVKDASSYLPAYDQRTYSEVCKALTSDYY